MNTEYMEYVLKILDSGNISAAAKKLYMSQPLLSQKLKQVESELGMPIFDRNTVPISLTPAGQKFVEAARQVLNIMGDVQRTLEEIQDSIRGTIRIGISHHRAVQLLPELLSQYMKQYPLVMIQVIEYPKGRFSDAVLSGKVDMAFIRSGNSSSDLELEVLSRDRMLLVGGTGTKIARTVEVGSTVALDSSIAQDPFVSIEEDHGFRVSQDAIFDRLSRQGVKPIIAMETTTIELACLLAISCNYVALVPETFQLGVPSEVKKAFWCYVDTPDSEGMTPQFCLCYRKGMFLPRYMLDFILLSRQLYNVN